MKKVRHNTYYYWVSLLTTLLILTAVFVNPGQIDAAPVAQQQIVKKVLVSGTANATELYIIDSQQSGPVVMIVGGVHGSEIAGVQGAKKFINLTIKKGKLLVLPEANKRALAIKKRTASGQSDLNRMFPQSTKQSADTALSKAIYEVVRDYKVEWLMDMHEGFDYYKNTKTDSVGQTLIHYPSAQMTPMANTIVSTLNSSITKSSQKFTLLKYPVKGSLARSSAQYLGVNAFIFETSMKQTLTTRVNQQEKAANTLLKKLGII